ncbi:hypothetical protein ACFL6I_13775 [candidate division KSB1 bacterium]
MADETFFFKAFEEFAKQEPEPAENVLAPVTHTNKEYLAKLMCYGFDNMESMLKTAEQYVAVMKQEEDVNTALHKMIRSLFNVDDEDDNSSGYWERILEERERSNDALQTGINYCILERVVKSLFPDSNYSRSEGYQLGYRGVKAELIGIAMKLDEKLNSLLMLREPEPYRSGQSFVRLAYQRSEDDAKDIAAFRSRERLKLIDTQTFEGAEEMAHTLLTLYPLLEDRKILEQALNMRELAYTICAGFAPEVIQTEYLQRKAVDIVRGDAPPRLKLLTSLMCTTLDNTLQVCNMAANATEEGYAREQTENGN